jgi:hypothetical protein
VGERAQRDGLGDESKERNVKIDDLTIGEAKHLAAMFSGAGCAPTEAHPLVGKAVLVCTVTRYFTGRCVAVTDREIVLTDAAWIADTGRFADAMKAGAEFREVEPYPDGRLVYVQRGGVTDWCEYHATPRSQK